MIFPLATPFGESPVKRLQSDVVLALAVTHHLLLVQKIPVARILKTIGAYSRRLVFVEFMPLGLWDGRTAPPVPAGYTIDWFRRNFAANSSSCMRNCWRPTAISSAAGCGKHPWRCEPLVSGRIIKAFFLG